MIGKIIEYIEYEKRQTGTIIDKIIVGKKVKVDMPSGMGGTTTGSIYISVTNYLVRNHNSTFIKSIEPANIIEIKNPN